ncbi:MAG: hypothetical protein J5I93_27825 [Pirellulaceae bacterium]|nr:hypothetical protein [Pirellulaceae bacterium]
MNALHTARPSVDLLARQISQGLRRLIDSPGSRTVSRQQLADSRLLLEALPMATNEFAVARRRLQNADRYLRSDEWGAARYELRLLYGMLRQYEG